jgi:hypothetical protein
MKTKLHRLSLQEKQEVRRHIAELIESQKEVVFAYLYGSFIEEVPFHDIDVGIYVSGIGESEAGFFAVGVADRLSRAIGIEVDVRVLNYSPASFVYRVICGELILERDPDARSRVVERSIQEYLDMKPLLRRAMKEAFAP